MQTKTLIQTTANVVKITELHQGNVVKMVETEYNNTKISFGIVTDLLNSGAESFIQLLLFDKNYNNITGSVRVFSGDKDISLFPATVEEVQEDLQQALHLMENAIEKGKEELQNKISAFEIAKMFISGETSKQLTDSSFEEVTTKQYEADEKQKQIAAIEKEDLPF